MFLQVYHIIFLIILTSVLPCFSSFQKNPLSNHQTHGEYPSFLASRRSLLAYENEIHDHRRFSKVGSPTSSPNMVNVDDFGAKGDGISDDTKAFKSAWKKACSSRESVLVVPNKKNYYLKPITFSGPCKSSITLKIHGTLLASPKRSDYASEGRFWLLFENITNFKVEGGGTINGNGQIWWKNSCKINKTLPCKHAPTAITFNECKNLELNNLRIKNAQQMHLTIQRCVDVRASRVMITSPGNSPNTDGIHVTGTQNIQIRNCVIRTGDDCISIVSGSKNVQAMDITCGPGHGISIGSLGSDNSEAEVSGVVVNRATLSGTTNGVRIKTWQGGSGYAKNIKFQNIVMHNVSNPIIIDQNYCDQKEPCQEQESAVQVKNVVYQNIKGTSASEISMKFNCSNTWPCQGIVLQNIDLPRHTDGKAEASCENVNTLNKGVVSPKCA